MAGEGEARGLETLTGSSLRADRREGTISGQLFREIRERVQLSQEQMAETLRVDKTTIQGWESGRRPLNSTRTGALRVVKRNLLRLGGDPALLALLDQALDADSIVNFVLSGPPIQDADDHPLTSWVLTRGTTHMLAWALTGASPAALPPVEKRSRRGPAATSALLPLDERKGFFEQMRRAAEVAQSAGDDAALLRRQALYLCSYDTASDTAAWLADIRRKQSRTTQHGWSPDWADARSVATSLTRHGDNDALASFMQTGLQDDVGEGANLNYWAYWLGIDTLPKADDHFMLAKPGYSWDALALLRGLTERLKPGLGAIDLNVHSVWALLALRPQLLASDTALSATLRERIATLLDFDGISTQARQELISVHYGLRMTT
ncbi:helix-turn-helix domain-containing protein [Kitasatospora sp. P5_F3]